MRFIGRTIPLVHDVNTWHPIVVLIWHYLISIERSENLKSRAPIQIQFPMNGHGWNENIMLPRQGEDNKFLSSTVRDSDGPTPTYSQHPSRMTETTILFCYWNFVSSISSREREREREDVLDLVRSTPMSHSVWIHTTNS